MPMGASLVEGLESFDGNGFRRPLKEMLTENGWSTDMVGTQQVGNMTDNDQEAYPGYTVNHYNQESYDSGAYDLNPHVMLVLVGTNDCWYNEAERETDDPRNQAGVEAAERFGNLLLTMRREAPNALVLAATAVRNVNDWANDCAIGFNEKLPEVVEQAANEGQDVRLVEMYEVVPVSEMQEDGTHPTDYGYSMMAEKWYESIVDAREALCPQRRSVDESATSSASAAAASSTADVDESSANVVASSSLHTLGLAVAMTAWVLVVA